jgi:hypothetical protein
VNLEQQLRDALARADDYPASPDLFARVTRTLEEDVRRRTRVRRTIGGALTSLAAAATFLGALSSVDGGQLLVPGWAFEVVVTAALVVLATVLAPALRRFGEAYLADVLGRALAPQFAALLDLAYALLCIGYVLATATVDPSVVTTPVDPAQLSRATVRTGGLALTLGISHTLTITVLPLLGLLLRSTRWRAGRSATPDARARAADRVASVFVGLLLTAVAGGVLIALVLVMVVGVSP